MKNDNHPRWGKSPAEAALENFRGLVEIFEGTRRAGKSQPTILAPALYDQAVSLNLIHNADPSWARGTLTVGELSNKTPKT